MAGDWLKVETDTPDKPEILAIAAALGVDPDEAFGKCFRLWRWFDKHTEKGNARSVTKALLDRQLGVSGLCDALETVGWLIVTSEGIELPNFDRHNGQTAKRRALTSKRVAKHKESGNAKGNAASVSGALAREEKRRVEKKEDNTPYSPPKKKSKPKADEPRDYSPAFLQFWDAYPSVRKGSKPVAWEAWQKAVCRVAPETILAAVAEFAQSWLASSEFCPGPAPWLNQDRWDDDRQAWQRRDGPASQPSRPTMRPAPTL